MKRNPHVGSDFDNFLQEEGILDEVQAVAVKRVLTYQLERGMKAKQTDQDCDGQADGNDPRPVGSAARPRQSVGNPGHAGESGQCCG